MEIISIIADIVLKIFSYVTKKFPRIYIEPKAFREEKEYLIAELEIKNESSSYIESLNFYSDYYSPGAKSLNYFKSDYECMPFSSLHAKIKIPKAKCFGQFIIYATIMTYSHHLYIQEYCISGNQDLKWNHEFYMRKNGTINKIR